MGEGSKVSLIFAMLRSAEGIWVGKKVGPTDMDEVKEYAIKGE